MLFITTANLATNPRLVKELRLANEQGYNATVILFKMGNWSDKLDNNLMMDFKEVRFIQVSALRSPFLPWLLSSLLETLFRIFPSGILNLYMLSVAVGKRSFLLLKEIKKLNERFDWVIAHNPAAFYPACVAAGKTNASLGIDIEDYHPGEGKDVNLQKKVTRLMQAVLPGAVYCSFASPLIKEYTEKLTGQLSSKNFIVINNNFSKYDFLIPSPEIDLKRKLRFVWFSQFIDYGRGLEKLLPLLDSVNDAVELTLIGSVREFFFKNELAHRGYITCLPSLSQDELHKQLSGYDIGLAAEDITADVNRNICLTNKIWAYFQSGLYILATDTDAQKQFLQQYAGHGELIWLAGPSALAVIDSLIKKREEILAGKQSRCQDASKYSWEKESEFLLSKWNEILAG